MCGIGGFQGAYPISALQKMIGVLSHRGPDDSGQYFNSESRLGLLQTRLSIQDLSPMGHQPMLDASGKVVLVFNGEIYNFRELREDMQDYPFRGHSDTEVLLALYLRFGIEMLTKLNGIFAFAIWDSRTQELILARDAMGIKPIYYCEDGNGFIFASEIKAFLNLNSPNGDIDYLSLHRYMSFLWCPGEGTPLKKVKKLQPGEFIRVKEGVIRERTVWYQLPIFRKGAVNLNKASIVENTAQFLRQAVHRQLVSDVPVGAFLSGGLDSSAIVAMAREVIPDIHCFTIESKGGSEAGMVDDLPYAKQVAKHLGVRLDIIEINSSQMALDIVKMISMLDEPLADPAPLNVLYISELARKNGIKVLLSGAGGDDLFTGYRRHQALVYEKYWKWLPKSILSGLNHFSARLDQSKPIFRRLSKLFDGAGLVGNESIANYFVWMNESRLLSLYTPDVRETVSKEIAIQPMLNFLSPLPKNTSRLEMLLALEQRFFLSDHNLTYTDKMSMAVGVEVRVPFLDTELVEFAAKIPADYKQRGGIGKWILKKSMEPYLPHNVIYRPKTGFGAPLRRWMRFELRELLGDLLSEASIKSRGIFDSTAVQKLIADNDSGRIDASYTLLSLLSIEIWCRQFVDNKFDYSKVYANENERVS